MLSTRYLIVGGGLTADAAARGIRACDADGPVLLVSAEADAPYARPPLSKKLWTGGDEEKIWCRTGELDGVEVSLGCRIATLDLAGRRATDDRGQEIAWEKLLLATGGRPRTLGAGDGIVYYRTLADYRALRGRARKGAIAVVVGGGFIGSEIAAALSSVGCKVTMIFPSLRSARASCRPVSPRSSPTATASTASRCSPARRSPLRTAAR